MKIIMTKREAGIYAQWYEVRGLNADGYPCWFLIYKSQARTYPQAVRYWNRVYGKKCKAFYLRNSSPFSPQHATCC